MLEWILIGVGAAGMHGGPVATADGEVEGLKGAAFATGGVRFSGVNQVSGVRGDGSPFGPGDLGSQVIVERAAALASDVPLFLSLPNAITFGDAFEPGDSASFGPLASVRIDADGRWRYAGLDLIYPRGSEHAGVEVVLDAFLDGERVARSVFEVGGAPEEFGGRVGGARILLKAAAFDSLELSARRNGEYTVVPALVDNVSFAAPAPGPLALAFAAVGAGVRRRR